MLKNKTGNECPFAILNLILRRTRQSRKPIYYPFNGDLAHPRSFAPVLCTILDNLSSSFSFQEPTGYVFETCISYPKLNRVEITVFSGDDLFYASLRSIM